MKPETWIAIYAAIVGSGALLLNFKSWLDSGPRLFLTVIPDGMIIGGDPQFDEKNLVIVSVVNRGTAATMITNLTLHEFPSTYARWRNRPSKSLVVLNPQLKGYPPCIPFGLEPNKNWNGVVRNRPDLPTDLHTGKVYVALHTTHRDKPYLAHIPKDKARPTIVKPE
jgi:hypothetical protein